MGNSQSSLEQYRIRFDEPKIGDLDLSDMKVYQINNAESAKTAEDYLRNKRILYVDCEGNCFGGAAQKLGTVQVATDPYCCLIFHITRYRKSLDFLKNLFESDKVRKVFHDCSGDSAVLFHENQIRLTNRSVDDTQIAHKVIEFMQSGEESIDRRTGPSLAELYRIYCGKKIPGNKRIKHSGAGAGRNMWIDNHELTPRMIKYAVVDTVVTCEVFTAQERYQRMLTRIPNYKELIQLQLERKINFEPKMSLQSGQPCAQTGTSGSSNWGLFAVGVGAAALLTLGAVAAAHAADKDENDKKRASQCRQNEKRQKKDECIIS